MLAYPSFQCEKTTDIAYEWCDQVSSCHWETCDSPVSSTCKIIFFIVVANQLSYKVPEEEEKEDEEKEEQGSTSSVLGNVKENQEFLEMLVENILSSLGSGSDSPSASETFSLEILPDTAMAVVTFQSVQGSKYCFLNTVWGSKYSFFK